MEDFNEKIKDKISSYEYSHQLTDEKVGLFFEKLDDFDEQQDKVHPIINTNTKRFSFIWKIAASFSLLITISYGLYRMNDVSITIGNKTAQQVVLPDGSDVQLNAGSSLQYNKLAWTLQRKISLKGEAFFNVQNGEKFTVISDLGSTEVLGTSFNIYSRENIYRVKCFSGRVVVSSALKSKLTLLTPGKGIDIEKNREPKKFVFDENGEKDWRKGEFFFENNSLKEVFSTLSRQYDVQVVFNPNLENQGYTGYFDNKDLNKSLKLICEPIGLTYSIRGNIVEIK
ncbi:MAG: FecR domain-containing protein [Cyclobacteriaceae bacterium]